MTLTKADLLQMIVKKYALEPEDARQIIELFFEKIKVNLARGQEIKLSGFGNFSVHDKNIRPGRNPKTGEPAQISARRSVSFRSSMKFKQIVVENTDPHL